MAKKIVIINGHPTPNSYNQSIVEAYRKGAQKTDAKVETIQLNELDFQLNLEHGYHKRIPLEPDLLEALEKIKNADHMVWVHPIWWYSMPALLKGFIDRTFLPGIAFKSKEGNVFPEQLFKGKSARIITTSDTPWWYYALVMKQPATHQLKKGTLEFCGVKPVKTTYIGPIKNSEKNYREKWLIKVEELGKKLV